MNAIIEQIKETIALKKKEAEQNQQEVNSMNLHLAERVQKVYQLKNEVSNLESELYSLEKQTQEQKCVPRYSDAGCAVGPRPDPNYKPLYKD